MCRERKKFDKLEGQVVQACYAGRSAVHPKQKFSHAIRDGKRSNECYRNAKGCVDVVLACGPEGRYVMAHARSTLYVWAFYG